LSVVISEYFPGRFLLLEFHRNELVAASTGKTKKARKNIYCFFRTKGGSVITNHRAAECGVFSSEFGDMFLIEGSSPRHDVSSNGSTDRGYSQAVNSAIGEA